MCDDQSLPTASGDRSQGAARDKREEARVVGEGRIAQVSDSHRVYAPS